VLRFGCNLFPCLNSYSFLPSYADKVPMLYRNHQQKWNLLQRIGTKISISRSLVVSLGSILGRIARNGQLHETTLAHEFFCRGRKFSFAPLTEASLDLYKIWKTVVDVLNETSSADVARAFILAYRVMRLIVEENGNNSWLSHGTYHCNVRRDYNDTSTGIVPKSGRFHI
jgi:hypothetical protein